MKTETAFNPDTDRYAFDAGECADWAQVDTRQDAHYYGNWCDPEGLRFTTYAEGDITRRQFDDADELARFLWAFRLSDDSMRIDPGIGARGDLLAAALESIGCGELLHGAGALNLPDPRDLSLANVLAESRAVDGFTYGDVTDATTDCPFVEPVLPPLIVARLLSLDVAESFVRDALEGSGDIADALEDAREDFRDSDSGYEWADGFLPMMNFLWPVDLPFEADPETVAYLLDTYAPSVTLLDVGADAWGDRSHAFALTGGGMDLSDQLAAAYLVAGSVPPLALLESNWADEQMRTGPLAGHWLRASDKAAQWLNRRAGDLVRRIHRMTGGRGLSD